LDAVEVVDPKRIPPVLRRHQRWSNAVLRLARKKLQALTELVRPARQQTVAFGFNEWFRATDGQPCGQDWQTWSAAMYLYAAACVERRTTPFFEAIRGTSQRQPARPPVRHEGPVA